MGASLNFATFTRRQLQYVYDFKTGEVATEIHPLRDSIFARMAQNRDPNKLWLAVNCASRLYADSNKENRLIGRTALRQIAECQGGLHTHIIAMDALRELRTHLKLSTYSPDELPDFVEDKAFATPRLYAIAENPDHIFSQNAIITLAEQPEESEKPYLQSLLYKVIENQNRPCSDRYTYHALSRLLAIGDESAKAFAHAELTKIAETEDHPYAKEERERLEREVLIAESKALVAKYEETQNVLLPLPNVTFTIGDEGVSYVNKEGVFYLVDKDGVVISPGLIPFLTDKDGVEISANTVTAAHGLREEGETTR